MTTCTLPKQIAMPCLVIGLVLATTQASHVVAAEGPKSLQEFTLKEHFGVSHAEQVVVFELQKQVAPGSCYLLDETGKEVPFQIVEGGPQENVS